MLKIFKNVKEINVIDFTQTFWGHNFNIISKSKLNRYLIACWYTNIEMLPHNVNRAKLKNNAIFLSKGYDKAGVEKGFFLGRIKNVSKEKDPDDMYFFKVIPIRNSKNLSKEEFKYLKEYIKTLSVNNS